ncbi:MAG: 2-oxo acid dehydrogenase subunit E2 [Bacteroidia bacterium]|nr:2-oxo acid dehydrogenase subunit E2 [Bacteroidia bacterium]HRA73473.1 2-oxo acid dehydrogenase subunit E2 [Flavobacterium sp.]MBP7715331.1 2-oxo acid dehydrogenase subunit E2 [Bacteroidia bacterium]MBP8668989.1 2-oxo acid dehydrogenase subunit E2 [Bacteroidia bacterium]HOZ91236.1 2-oxo acid dehydrogenase subunit E2 [Bacteroidia bacterium]
MEKNYQYQNIVRSRIATFDIFDIGLRKHHINAILEFDVTESRAQLHELRKNGTVISFNAWLIKVIGTVLKKHPEAASYIYSRKRLIMFNDINVSLIVEKEIGNSKVPIPIVIEKTNEKSAYDITIEIENAKSQKLDIDNIVLKSRANTFQTLYYHLPGFFRKLFWRILLRNPKLAFKTMGNVAVTSIGMIGRINGWFIHKSVHPISFGIASIIKKPIVIENKIEIREILNMTILVDHDIIDGAPMVRLLNDLTNYIETGKEINA